MDAAPFDGKQMMEGDIASTDTFEEKWKQAD